MMKFKQTEELSREYEISIRDQHLKEYQLCIKVVWHDNEDEWAILGSSGANYTQCELEEMWRIVTSLNKEKK